MELLFCILLGRKCGDTGVSGQAQHLSAEPCCVSAFACDLPPAIALEGCRKGQWEWGRKKELFSLVWKSVIISFPMMVVYFLKVASPLWETELSAQLGHFLEVILECMAALRPGTVC